MKSEAWVKVIDGEHYGSFGYVMQVKGFYRDVQLVRGVMGGSINRQATIHIDHLAPYDEVSLGEKDYIALAGLAIDSKDVEWLQKNEQRLKEVGE